MVRSVILVSIIALYVSMSTVEAQKTNALSNESISNLIAYLNKHPISEGAVKTASASADSQADKAIPADVPPNPANEVSEAENDNANVAVADNENVPVDAPPASGSDNDAAQQNVPPENIAEPAENASPEEKGSTEDVTREENEPTRADPANEDIFKKGDAKKEGTTKNDISRESISDPVKASLRESLRESLRQSMRESMKASKDSKSGESSKSDILSSLRAANLLLAQTNRNDAQLGNANMPKDQGVILAGEASDSTVQGEGLSNNATESSNLQPSDSTRPQGAEPTNAPITNFDMSVTAGMIFTNGGSSMSAASASMSAPSSSGTSSAGISSKPSASSSTTTSRLSATSTAAAHSGGHSNNNNYSLMFIGFTIFMSNMITIGFFW